MILGDYGLGPVVAKATALVLRKAKEFGIGLVSVAKHHISEFYNIIPSGLRKRA